MGGKRKPETARAATEAQIHVIQYYLVGNLVFIALGEGEEINVHLSLAARAVLLLDFSAMTAPGSLDWYLEEDPDNAGQPRAASIAESGTAEELRAALTSASDVSRLGQRHALIR